MSESALRKNVVKALKNLDAIAVENGKVHPGTPDVNYVEGWIELKYLAKWPLNSHKEIVKFDNLKFRPEQRVWIKRRANRGGSVFLLLKVGKGEHLLFKGEDAANYLGKLNRPKLVELSIMHHTQGLNKKELLRCLESHKKT